MSVKEFLLENLAGDLEYHPRRAAVYLVLAAAAAGFWVLSPPERKFTPAPLVFALGSLTLAGKGLFLLRPSSEGFGVSDAELEEAKHKSLPSIPEQAAQIVQDFGTGGLLLWPLLTYGKDVDARWSDPRRFPVFAAGAVLFGLGWLIRRLTRREEQRA